MQPIHQGRADGPIRRLGDGTLVVDDLSGGTVRFGAWDDDEDDDDFGWEDEDDDDFEGEWEDEDDFEGASFLPDDDDGELDELGRRRRRRRRKRRPPHRRRRRTRRARPRRRRAPRPPAPRPRPKPKESWVATVVSGRTTLASPGNYTISIRPQHPFRAKDVAFTGPTPQADTVTSVFFADRQVFSDPNGVPMAIFAAQGFLRDLMQGQSLRAGLDITVQGVLSAPGTAGAHFTGSKPADSGC